MDNIMDVHEIRRLNLQQLATDFGGPTALGERLDRSQSQMSQLLSDKLMGSKLARDIEKRLDLIHGWMDHQHGMEAREEMGKYKSGGGGRSSVEDKKRAAWMHLFDELERQGKSDAALRLLRNVATELRRDDGTQEGRSVVVKKRAR